MTSSDQSFNFMTLFVGAIIGASVTALTNYLLRLWQYKRDNWLRRVDWFCETVEKTADLATEYWCFVDSETNSDTIKAHKLLGLQNRLDGLITTLSWLLPEQESEKISSLMVIFRDTITGGEFLSENRSADTDRVRDLQVAASELIINIRKSADAMVAPSSELSKIFTYSKRFCLCISKRLLTLCRHLKRDN